jgi:hypothetical protein
LVECHGCRARAAGIEWRLGFRLHGFEVGRTSNGASEKLHIVSKVSAGDIEFMDHGGDVVLLGIAPFTTYTRWPSFMPAKGYRPFSNGGTIIEKHPIFAGHPNEGWNDWLFYPLMMGANSVLFDGAIDMMSVPRRILSNYPTATCSSSITASSPLQGDSSFTALAGDSHPARSSVCNLVAFPRRSASPTTARSLVAIGPERITGPMIWV